MTIIHAHPFLALLCESIAIYLYYRHWRSAQRHARYREQVARWT